METNRVVLRREEAEERLVSVLNAGDLFPLRVTGSSMVPFLKDKKDTVWLRAFESPRRGDILFFRRKDGRFILHRIRKCYPDGRMLVNGDAQTWCETVLPEQAMAIVLRITHENGSTVQADCFRLRLLRTLWYPTISFRPFLFRVYGFLKNLFRPGKTLSGTDGDEL